MVWIVFIVGTILLVILERFIIRNWQHGFRRFAVLALWGIAFGMAIGIASTWDDRPLSGRVTIGLLTSGVMIVSAAAYTIASYERERGAALHRENREG